VVNNLNQPSFLYENTTDSSAGFLVIKGLKSGSEIMLTADGEKMYKYHHTVAGFMSSSSQYLHLGLGNLTIIDTLRIRTYPGKDLILTSVPVNQIIDIADQVSRDTKSRPIPAKDPLSASFSSILHAHSEDNFRDYDREILIPHLISTEGPAIARGDVNKDGYADLYLGGAHHQPGILYLGKEDGNFLPTEQVLFKADAAHEDVDALFFDADGDGDQDLMVVSGGNVYQEGNPLLRDRVYLNDGQGNFNQRNIKFPAFNGGCLAVIDLDGDEDLDVFIGNRSVPGEYGVSPLSYLLLNDGQGNFTIEWQESIGMVTDAAWVTGNHDEDPDLLVVGEWMSPTLYLSEEGSLDAAKKRTLSGYNGWWNSLAVQDLNQDGIDDFLAGNLGLNSKLKASTEQPVRLYLGDYDQNGQVDPLLFYYQNGVEIPFATKNELIAQIPALKKTFLSFEEYAAVEGINDLTRELPGTTTVVLEAEQFRSGYFISQSDSGYQFTPFPTQVQFGPVQDLLWDQENKRYVLVGNFFGAVSGFGPYDALSGLYLDPKFNFLSWMNIPPKDYRRVLKNSDQYYLFPNNDRPLTLE
jgi:hypothetical protein